MRKIFVFMFLYVDKWNYHVGFFLSEPTYVVHIFTISVQSRKTKKKHCINAKWFSAHVSLKMTICLAGCDATAALYTNTNATPPDRNTLVLTHTPNRTDKDKANYVEWVKQHLCMCVCWLRRHDDRPYFTTTIPNTRHLHCIHIRAHNYNFDSSSHHPTPLLSNNLARRESRVIQNRREFILTNRETHIIP